jgi:hypothetical protein
VYVCVCVCVYVCAGPVVYLLLLLALVQDNQLLILVFRDVGMINLC